MVRTINASFGNPSLQIPLNFLMNPLLLLHTNGSLFAFPATYRSVHGRLSELLMHKCCISASRMTNRTKPKTVTILISWFYTSQNNSIF